MASKAGSNKKDKSPLSKLWDFVKGNTTSPTTYDIYKNLAKTEFELNKLHTIYNRLNKQNALSRKIRLHEEYLQTLNKSSYEYKLVLRTITKLCRK